MFSYNLNVFSFQRKVEMFHETQAEFGDRGDGYVSRTIALVNCCPPLRYTNNNGSISQLNFVISTTFFFGGWGGGWVGGKNGGKSSVMSPVCPLDHLWSAAGSVIHRAARSQQ